MIGLGLSLVACRGAHSVGGTLAASYLTLQFPAGADVAQSGSSDYLRLYLPSGVSHVFWAHAGTSTQPSLSGSPTYHQIDVDGLEADAVTALFCQAIVNAGSPTSLWMIPGYSQQTAPVNTVAPSFDNLTPSAGAILNLSVGTFTQGPTGYLIQHIRNGTNTGSPTSSLTWDTAGYANSDVLDFTVVASNSVGSSSPQHAAATATVTAEALTEYVTGFSGPLPTSPRNDFDGRVGFKTAFNRTAYITHLARRCLSGNSQVHAVDVVLPSGFILSRIAIDSSVGTPGSYQYVSIPTIQIDPGDIVDVMSRETTGGDFWENEGTTTTTDIATLSGSAYTSSPAGPGGIGTVGGKSYVPVNFKYTESAGGRPILLQKGGDDTLVYDVSVGLHAYSSTKFTAASTAQVKRVGVVFVFTVPQVIGTVTVSIYTNNAGVPGTLVGTSSIAVNRSDVIYFGYTEFSGMSANIVAGTVYHLVLNFSDTSAELLWVYGGGSGNGVQLRSDNGTTWVSDAMNFPMNFRLYGN